MRSCSMKGLRPRAISRLQWSYTEHAERVTAAVYARMLVLAHLLVLAQLASMAAFGQAQNPPGELAS